MASLFELLGGVDWTDLEGKKSRQSGVFEYSNSKIQIIMMIRELNKRLGVCFLLQVSLTHSSTAAPISTLSKCSRGHCLVCPS
jgi:penicillin-binding protein-related factor A (putative recombinase)